MKKCRNWDKLNAREDVVALLPPSTLRLSKLYDATSSPSSKSPSTPHPYRDSLLSGSQPQRKPRIPNNNDTFGLLTDFLIPPHSTIPSQDTQAISQSSKLTRSKR